MGSLDTSKFRCSCIVEIIDILRQLRKSLLHVLLDVLRQGLNNEVNFIVLLESGNQIRIEAVVVELFELIYLLVGVDLGLVLEGSVSFLDALVDQIFVFQSSYRHLLFFQIPIGLRGRVIILVFRPSNNFYEIFEVQAHIHNPEGRECLQPLVEQ